MRDHPALRDHGEGAVRCVLVCEPPPFGRQGADRPYPWRPDRRTIGGPRNGQGAWRRPAATLRLSAKPAALLVLVGRYRCEGGRWQTRRRYCSTRSPGVATTPSWSGILGPCAST